jgi:hypothetical protein
LDKAGEKSLFPKRLGIRVEGHIVPNKSVRLGMNKFLWPRIRQNFRVLTLGMPGNVGSIKNRALSTYTYHYMGSQKEVHIFLEIEILPWPGTSICCTILHAYMFCRTRDGEFPGTGMGHGTVRSTRLVFYGKLRKTDFELGVGSL